jgi:hypothetical protein
MNTIWKTPLNLGGDLVTEFKARFGKILHVGHDANGVPSIWYLAPESPEPEHMPTVRVLVVGTGHPFEEGPDRYIGTFTYRSLVLHAFVESAI